MHMADSCCLMRLDGCVDVLAESSRASFLLFFVGFKRLHYRGLGTAHTPLRTNSNYSAYYFYSHVISQNNR